MTYCILNYTHSDPLFKSLEGKMDIARENPLNSLRGVLKGSYEASVVSLISYLDNRNSLKVLPTANIHSMGTTGSTLLLSSGNLMGRHMKIAVTEATRTTSFYLSEVLKKMNIEFSLVQEDAQDAETLLERADYALVIGDEALKIYGSTYRILLDVGFEFSRLFRKSPLFAVTVQRKDGNEELASEINEAMRDHEKYNEQCSKEAADRLSLNPRIMEWYYSLIEYSYDNHVSDTLKYVSQIFDNQK